MDIILILKAFLVGLILAVPVGPMALLCIQRTLRFGFITGLITGTGVAVADAVFGLLGFLGLSVVSDFLLQYETIIKLAGGVFIGLLGIRILLESHKIKKSGDMPEYRGRLSALVSAFFLTLSNPMTIMAYIAVMAGMQINIEDVDHAWILAGPVFIGSFGWWSLLVLMAKMFKNKLNDHHIHRVSMTSGGLLIAFALIIFITAL